MKQIITGLLLLAALVANAADKKNAYVAPVAEIREAAVALRVIRSAVAVPFWRMFLSIWSAQVRQPQTSFKPSDCSADSRLCQHSFQIIDRGQLRAGITAETSFLWSRQY